MSSRRGRENVAINCIVTAFKSRNVVLKPRMRFVWDISIKMILSSFRVSVFGPGFKCCSHQEIWDLSAARQLRTEIQMHMNEAAAAASFLSASVQECRRGWNLNCRQQMG